MLVPPVRVATSNVARQVALNPFAVPGDPHTAIEWQAEVGQENGDLRQCGGRLRGSASLRLPSALPPGYHQLRLVARRRGGASVEARQTLIVTPRRCPLPADILGRRQVFGLLVNLYTVRSATNWGAGDLSDLRAIIKWCGGIGAAFVGLNPLHALENTAAEVSPYSPISRLYRNVLYLDPGVVPELADSAPARDRIGSDDFRRELARRQASDRVDYDRVMALKLPVLRELHRTFAAGSRNRDDERARAYREYCVREGNALVNFATFCALQTYLGERQQGRDWRRWPPSFRDYRSAAVEWFREERHEDVDFHRYLQFELDRQLALVATAAKKHRLPLGVYQDLALGSSAGGADTWSFPDLFVHAVRVGAPPDNYNARGQNWAFPPIDPRRLAADRYAYWIQLVRSALAHAGAVRIDHILGLHRQYWIPAGWSPADGAYVRFPADDLFGIVALESERAGALVVGEDLGTVPPEVPRLLERWGVLSTRVLYFERDRGGGYRSARRYPTRALAGANTHDLATLTAFWRGSDLDLRRSLGIYATDAQWRRAKTERGRERRALVRRLRSERLLAGKREASAAEMCAAVHGFLCRTPAALVGVALDDLVGEIDPVNIPGVGLDRYPNWSRRQHLPLEALGSDPGVARALAGTQRRRWRRRQP